MQSPLSPFSLSLSPPTPRLPPPQTVPQEPVPDSPQPTATVPAGLVRHIRLRQVSSIQVWIAVEKCGYGSRSHWVAQCMRENEIWDVFFVHGYGICMGCLSVDWSGVWGRRMRKEVDMFLDLVSMSRGFSVESGDWSDVMGGAGVAGKTCLMFAICLYPSGSCVAAESSSAAGCGVAEDCALIADSTSLIGSDPNLSQRRSSLDRVARPNHLPAHQPQHL
jgi:hypothetical protein